MSNQRAVEDNPIRDLRSHTDNSSRQSFDLYGGAGYSMNHEGHYRRLHRRFDTYDQVDLDTSMHPDDRQRHGSHKFKRQNAVEHEDDAATMQGNYGDGRLNRRFDTYNQVDLDTSLHPDDRHSHRNHKIKRQEAVELEDDATYGDGRHHRLRMERSNNRMRSKTISDYRRRTRSPPPLSRSRISWKGPPRDPRERVEFFAREIFVGNVPKTASEDSLFRFFSRALAKIENGRQNGHEILGVKVAGDNTKRHAFLELNLVKAATNMIALNGIKYEGCALEVKRPLGYNKENSTPLGPAAPVFTDLNVEAVGLVPDWKKDRNCLVVSGLYENFSEENVEQLLASIGPVRWFELHRDRMGNFTGYVYCVYEEPSNANLACKVFDDLDVAELPLKARRIN